MKQFDLNIEKVLEDWEVFHAIREVIANALDETVLSGARDIEIFKHENTIDCWHVRDFGRGLRYQHLTQKENEEKLNSAKLIGKFGVGLKDALATFDRRGIAVKILSPHGDITLQRVQKHGFADIVTLHAAVSEPSDPNLQGTDFTICGITDEDMETAKRMFLRFSGDEVLESTPYGDVLRKHSDAGTIYISGVKVAEEENFLFSYNITSLTGAIKKALNRERTNVGRTVYTDRVKSILLASRSGGVANAMMSDLGNFQKGTMADELKWTDVYVHACKLLNAQNKVIFLTPNDRGYAAGVISYARSDGYKIITIPDNIKAKLRGQTDYDGNPIVDINEYIRVWNESFEFELVEPDELTPRERRIFEHAPAIMKLIGGKPEGLNSIAISETMRLGKPGTVEVVGVWEPDIGRIVIKRSQLESLQEFAGTLLHELAHATTDAPDISEIFERELTAFLGLTAMKGLRSKPARAREKAKKRRKAS